MYGDTVYQLRRLRRSRDVAFMRTCYLFKIDLIVQALADCLCKLGFHAWTLHDQGGVTCANCGDPKRGEFM